MRPGNKYQPVFGDDRFSRQKHGQKKSDFLARWVPRALALPECKEKRSEKDRICQRPRGSEFVESLEKIEIENF